MTWQLRAAETVPAPPSTVWSVLTDVGAYRVWNPVLRVYGDLAEGARPLVVLLDRDLPPTPFRPRVTRVEPEREVRWRTRLPLGAVDATHAFRVEPTAAGTRFVQAERFDGAAADAVLRRLSTAVRRTFERMNEALAHRAETLADDGIR